MAAIDFCLGAPSGLTPEVHKTIIDAVPLVLMPRQVARYTKLPQTTLLRWLSNGKRDQAANVNSNYAQLWMEFEHVLSKEINILLEKVRTGAKNWQGAHEILKVAARDDFGGDAIEYKELVDLYNKLFESYKRLQEKPLTAQGAIEHGSEETQKLD